MVTVEFDSVTKRYGDTIGVRDVDVTVEDGEFAILLGPSGCGKTTTLRCLAGLVTPTSGTIRIDDRDVTDAHPKNRDIAMVFQNLALYPHMNVSENIGYPLKVSGIPEDERNERVEEVAEVLEIADLLDRSIDNISGGQAQRVAIGRAIIRRPGVFLMDEPLASLDAKLQVEMRRQIKLLQRELDITTLFVTHNQEEAQTLGDKLIIMNDARIEQIGSPYEVFHEPENRFVAGFIGSPSMNFVRVEWAGESQIRAVSAPETFAFEFEEPPEVLRSHDEFDLGVRPQYFELHTEPTSNAVRGTVSVTEPSGDDQIATVFIGDDRSNDEMEVTVITSAAIEVERDQDVWLEIDQDRCHAFDVSTGDRIGEGTSREVYEEEIAE